MPRHLTDGLVPVGKIRPSLKLPRPRCQKFDAEDGTVHGLFHKEHSNLQGRAGFTLSTGDQQVRPKVLANKLTGGGASN